MHLLLVSHLLGRYMILVIFPTPVEPLLVPLPEVVVYSPIKPIVGKETVVIPVLNGIDHIDILGHELGHDPVLGGLAMIVAHLRKPGFTEQIGQLHFIEFGEVRGGHSKRCADLEEFLSATGIAFRAIPNITERMWWKLYITLGVR